MPDKRIWEKTQDELSDAERVIVENDDALYLRVYNNTVDQMYEITDEMREFMDRYPYGSQDEIKDPKEIKVMAHFFNPVHEQDWIITENYDCQNNRHYFYGCAILDDKIGWEWGVLPSLEELKGINLGPRNAYLRIEKDRLVNVGDSLYDVLSRIDYEGLYDLGLLQREVKYETEAEQLVRIEKEKFSMLRDITDEETYDKTLYYLYKENKTIDDVFDVDRFYYDPEECFDQDVIDEYYQSHEYRDRVMFLDELIGMPDIEETNEFIQSLSKDNGKDFGKEL